MLSHHLWVPACGDLELYKHHSALCICLKRYCHIASLGNSALLSRRFVCCIYECLCTCKHMHLYWILLWRDTEMMCLWGCAQFMSILHIRPRISTWVAEVKSCPGVCYLNADIHATHEYTLVHACIHACTYITLFNSTNARQEIIQVEFKCWYMSISLENGKQCWEVWLT